MTSNGAQEPAPRVRPANGGGPGLWRLDRVDIPRFGALTVLVSHAAWDVHAVHGVRATYSARNLSTAPR